MVARNSPSLTPASDRGTTDYPFFGEPHHFAHLRDQVLPVYCERGGSRRLRIWSSGCANGAEAYSIAMTLIEVMPDVVNRDTLILATDFDPDLLVAASIGHYDDEHVQDLSQARLQRFFTQHKIRGRSTFVVRPEVRSLVTFTQLDVLQPLPMSGPFDVIFCRNSLHPDNDMMRDLLSRMAPLQRPGNLLYLGQPDTGFSVGTPYESIGHMTYLRC